MPNLHVKRTADGKTLARRTDGQPLTLEDRQEAWRMIHVWRTQEDDPYLPVKAWFPVFAELHRRVVQESRDFDYGWTRQNNPELYRGIKNLEDQIDGLGDARLSKVMDLVGRWRSLVLRGVQEQMEFERGEIDKE